MTTSASGPNSSKPTTGQVVAGVYNAAGEVLVNGQATPVQVDVNGNLKVAVAGASGTSNVNIADVAGNPPALSNALPVELSDGTNAVGTAGNPLSVNVISGGGSNASVGTTGATAPTSATEIGVIDGTGKLQGVSSSNPVRIDPTGTTTQPVSLPAGQAVELLDSGGTNKASISAAGAVKVDGSAVTQPISGTVTANQGTAAALTAGWPTVTGQTAESTAAWTSATGGNTAVTLTVQGLNTVVVTLAQGTTITGGVVTFEVSDTTGFTNAYPILGAPSTTNQGLALAGTFTLVANTNSAYTFNVAGWAAFRVRLSTVISGSGTVNVGVTASAAATVQAAYAVGGPAQYVSNSGGVNVAGNIGNPTDGSAASYFNAAGGGGRLGAVQDFVATGPASIAANTVAVRTPNFFKTVQATASGNTALWTPTTGKKFRLMRFMVQVTGNATTASGVVVTISFQDSASAMNIAMDVFVPASSLGTGDDFIGPWVDLGNGFLSAAANNVLNVNLSSTLATGNVRVTCAGTEE